MVKAKEAAFNGNLRIPRFARNDNRPILAGMYGTLGPNRVSGSA